MTVLFMILLLDIGFAAGILYITLMIDWGRSKVYRRRDEDIQG